MYTLDELAFIHRMEGQGIWCIRRLESGEWIGLHRFIFTVGLVIGFTDDTPHRTRFCYDLAHVADAVSAVLEWNGRGDPPGRWIKEKGSAERCNPHTCEGCFLAGCHKGPHS